MNILLMGGSGQLGSTLRHSLTRWGNVIAPTSRQINLIDTQAIRDFVQTQRPDLIVNAAAFTAVDLAESQKALASQINAIGPGALAQAANDVGAAMIHFSTDYVFDGTQHRPYSETDPVAPINVYGATKAAGESAVAHACQAYWIIRTSWLFGSLGDNFIRKILLRATERERLDVVNDQRGSPTSTDTIAAVLNQILNPAGDSASRLNDIIRNNAGIYHLCSRGETSWYDYARHIVTMANKAGVATRTSPDHIYPVSSDAYPTPAKRPVYSRLNTQKIENRFQITLPFWRDEVDRCVASILSEKADRTQ